MTVPSSYYTLDPIAKKISLFSPYNTISEEKILFIQNPSKQIEIYNLSIGGTA